MKRIFSLAVLGVLLVAGCKPDEAQKGLDNFQLNLNTDIFNYRMFLTFEDENGNPIPSDADVFLEGPDADKILNEFGFKEYFLNQSGNLNLTIDPRLEPTENDTLEFDILVVADGFENGSTTIRVAKGQQQIQEVIGVVSDAALNARYNRETHDIPTSGGTINASGILSGKTHSVARVVQSANLDSVYYDDKDVAVLLQEGASFYYYIRETYQVPRRPKLMREIFDTIKINGEIVPIKVKEEYYGDTIWLDRQRLKRVEYSGDELDIDIYYNDFDKSYGIDYGSRSSRQLSTALNGTDELARSFNGRITNKRINYVRYRGIDDDGKPVTLSVRDRSKIMYSFVVDPNIPNPSTNQPFQAGDIVENGSYWKEDGNLTTRRDTVRSAANGQLRIQSRYNDPGIYDFFLYETSVDLKMSITPPDTSIIPDIENIEYDFDTRLPLANGRSIGLFWSYSNYIYSRSERVINRSATVFTTDQASGPAETEVETSYWDRKWRATNTYNLNNGDIPMVPESFINQNEFEAKTTYSVSVVCAANDSSRLFPSVSASSRIGRNDVRAFLKDGYWATRGIALGDTMNISISYKDWTLDSSFVLTTPENVIEYVDETNLDICNF